MRTSRIAGVAAVVALSLAGLPAVSCGICIEDRVAAVYDQPTVDHAVLHRQHVVFFALNGALEATPATRSAVTVALDRVGVRGTAHVSLESATASVAFDPARRSPASIAAAGDKALAARGITLEALRVIRADGRLQEP